MGIKLFILKLPKTIKIIGGVITFTGVVWGGIKTGKEVKVVIVKAIVEKDRKEQTDKDRWAKMDSIIFNVTIQNNKLDTLIADRKYVRRQVRAIREDVSIISNSLEKHLLNSQKFDELYQLMKEREDRESRIEKNDHNIVIESVKPIK
jgi:hypothetical protein